MKNYQDAETIKISNILTVLDIFYLRIKNDTQQDIVKVRKITYKLLQNPESEELKTALLRSLLLGFHSGEISAEYLDYTPEEQRVFQKQFEIDNIRQKVYVHTMLKWIKQEIPQTYNISKSKNKKKIKIFRKQGGLNFNYQLSNEIIIEGHIAFGKQDNLILIPNLEDLEYLLPNIEQIWNVHKKQITQEITENYNNIYLHEINEINDLMSFL